MANGQNLSTLNRRVRFLEELEDVEYRRGFVEAHAKDTVAFQLRKMRKANEWEQKDVAREIGNPKLQPMISRYENPDYGRYSISTLLDLANVFDVALVVRFVPFSELAEWEWNTNDFTLCPASFKNDVRLKGLSAALKRRIYLELQGRATNNVQPTLPFGNYSGVPERHDRVPPGRTLSSGDQPNQSNRMSFLGTVLQAAGGNR